MLAAQAIQCGDADVVVAGGMENMSMAPYYLEKARFGHRMGPGKIEDHMVHDGLCGYCWIGYRVIELWGYGVNKPNDPKSPITL